MIPNEIPTRRNLLGVLLLGVLLVLGGGGTPAPLSELLCELAAAAVFAAWVAAGGAAELRHRRSLAWVTGLIVIVPMLQLLPVPPQVWRSFPGREQMAAALDLIGAGRQWHSLSIAPSRTLAAVLALGPPMLVMAIAATFAGRTAQWPARMIAAVALLSVLVGAGQIAGGSGGPLDFYTTDDAGVLHGFQANRNTEAIVLLIGIVALAAVSRETERWQSRAVKAVFAVLALVLVFGVLLTASRTGIALIPVAFAFAVAMLWSGKPLPQLPQLPIRRIAAGAAVLGAAGLAGAFLARTNLALGKVAGRFDFAGEFRPQLWRDTLYAVGQYWPFRSGLGTFIPAFLPAERLEVVDATLPHRAHNEFLELALEGGVPLLLCWTAAVAIVLWQLRRAWRTRPDAHPQLLLAAAIFSLTALHSLVDYPFRSMAMASLVALGAGLTFGLARPNRRAPRTRTDDGQ